MKFAQVGYGSSGQGAGKDGGGYTYLVNDNVRTGDTITPVVKHAKSGRIFGTTGVILARSSNNNSPKTDSEITTAYTQKELGIGRTRQTGTGKFIKQASTHDENGNYIRGRAEEAQLGGNVARYMAEHPDAVTTEKAQGAMKAYETFESYSKQFMPKGEQR